MRRRFYIFILMLFAFAPTFASAVEPPVHTVTWDWEKNLKYGMHYIGPNTYVATAGWKFEVTVMQTGGKSWGIEQHTYSDSRYGGGVSFKPSNLEGFEAGKRWLVAVVLMPVEHRGMFPSTEKFTPTFSFFTGGTTGTKIEVGRKPVRWDEVKN